MENADMIWNNYYFVEQTFDHVYTGHILYQYEQMKFSDYIE